MQRCFCCGEEVVGNQYVSAKCSKAMTRLRQMPVSSPEGSFSKFVDYSLTAWALGDSVAQRQIGADTVAALEGISADLEGIAATIEWGFEELAGQMAQTTAVLQSIERKLDRQEATKANEQRIMAEEMRVRGALDESESLFLKSRELNPLDYRTYVGLAKTYLHGNKFDEAKSTLLKGLPHALAENNGALVHRLLGRIAFAEGDTENAVECLKEAIQVSPDNALAHYDYAHYCALTGRKDDCLNSLRLAIMKDIALRRLAEREPDLMSIGEVRSLVGKMKPHLGLMSLMLNWSPAHMVSGSAKENEEIAEKHGGPSGYMRFWYEKYMGAEDELNKMEAMLPHLTSVLGNNDRDLKRFQKACEQARESSGSVQSFGHLAVKDPAGAEKGNDPFDPGTLAERTVFRIVDVLDKVQNARRKLDPIRKRVDLSAIPPTPSAPIQDAPTCGCGSQIDPQANFCSKCGAKIVRG